MCGRFTLTSDPPAIYAEFGINPPADWHPRYNIAPTQPVLAVIGSAEGLRVGRLSWGLVPYWSKDRADAHKRINARAESLLEKPSFRDAFARRRCLILADGFFEWARIGSRRQPMLIRRPDGRPFAFAGLWDRWKPPEGEPLYTCTIVTTDANPTVRPIHDRMPVILGTRERALWLDRESSPDKLQAMLQPSTMEFEVVPVSPLVNSPANDGPEVLQPL
ncbi:MAG TPA: SOS response-associated peptidase [Longimicrobiales bacterium]|nr:SOS response-associated peptidase [Longimicrobiales bacterium]